MATARWVAPASSAVRMAVSGYSSPGSLEVSERRFQPGRAGFAWSFALCVCQYFARRACCRAMIAASTASGRTKLDGINSH